MDGFMIFAAKYLVFLLIVLALIILVLQPRKEWKYVAILALPSLIVSYVAAKIAGKLYYDPRPFVIHHFKPLINHAANNGFPSDHALISFTFAAIVFGFNKKWGVAIGVLGLLVSWGRVYVGIHSPLDIFGSFVIGVVSVFITWKLINRAYNTKHE